MINLKESKMQWKSLVSYCKCLIMLIVNYDSENDKLRRIIQSLINDILSETESSLQRMLL